MKKQPRRGGIPLAAMKAGVVLAIAVAAAWLTGPVGITARPTRVWRGYYTLRIRTDLANAGAMGKVVDALGPGVVSSQRAPVRFWSFTGVDIVTVDGIDARIDASDPRHDRVMDGLVSYFRAPGESGAPAQPAANGRTWQIAYLPARHGALLEYLRIASVLGISRHAAWSLQELDPVELLPSLASLLAMAVLLASPFRKGGRDRLFLASAGAAMWFPFLLQGGVAPLALSLLLLTAWFPAAQMLLELHGWDDKLVREVRDPMVKLLTAAGAGLLLLLPATGFSAAAAVSYVGSTAGMLLLGVALALLWGRARRPRRRRKKFEPVGIVKPLPTPFPRIQGGFFLVLAAVLVITAIGFLRSVPLPTPLPVLGARDFSWESLTRLSREHRAQRLPDMSDLVTHEAFQETLSFGRPWGLPFRDERVTVREYRTNARDGSIAAVMRRVKLFDSVWLDAVVLHPSAGSIEGLLVSQRRAMAVAMRGQVRILLRELPVAVLVLFVFSAWFAGDRRAAPLMKNLLLRFNGAARRNQIP